MAFIAFAAVLAASAPAPVEQARQALAAQEAAWNGGLLEDALAAYCDRPDLLWVSARGTEAGFAEFASGMRRQFADRAAMGTMRIELLDARPAGRRGALTVTRWSIERDGRRLMGGVSTQLWARCYGRLRVVLEHAS
jgi:hypothetical protein